MKRGGNAMSKPMSLMQLLVLAGIGTARADSRATFNYSQFSQSDPTKPETLHCNLTGATDGTVVRFNTYYAAFGGASNLGQASVSAEDMNRVYFVAQHDPLFLSQNACVLFEAFTPDAEQPANVNINCEPGAGNRQFAYGFG
jgi:hypothetical protein